MKKFIFIAILLVGVNCLANDSYLGTNGGNIYPQKSSNISMIEENISINVFKKYGDVYCQFWFVNKGESDSVIVGFPDEYFYSDGASVGSKNFSAWINGVQTAVFRDSFVDSIGESGHYWYYWKTFFPKGDTVFIENKYRGAWGGTICERSFSYIIGTGNKWAGPIGKGRIVFHHGNLFSNLFIGRDIWREDKDLVPTYFEDSLVYEYSNYTPREDETLCLWVSSYWIDVGEDSNCPGFYIEKDELKNKSGMVDELFARCGHIFKEKQKQDYYSKKSWYKPVKELTQEELPKAINSYIKNLLDETKPEE